jgi:hypothetical protein
VAAVCLDHQSSSIISIDRVEVFETFPKIENHVGDIPYTLDESRILLLRNSVSHPDSCVGLKAFSVALIVMLGVIVWLTGGKVMYYIPLYAALIPVAYWLVKIGFAYYVVKTQKLHVDSKSFSGKNHG